MFDRGISYEGDLLDLAALGGIVEKTGASSHNYGSTRPRSQNRENAKQFLQANKDLAEEIRKAVLEAKGLLNAKRALDGPVEAPEAEVEEAAV